MDKQFWVSITDNDYQMPEGVTREDLTATLFSYLSSTDPQLRDEIAYIVYANWLKREMFTKNEVSQHIENLLANLEQGIGETETDSVFLRAFSALFLAEIVHNDNKKSLLEKEQVSAILAKGLWYLRAEKDPRGYIPIKGWAHAPAHTADLMLVLGRNRNVDQSDLRNILDAISAKMVQAEDHLYIHGEDERLARTVIEILRRNLLSVEEVEAWTKSLTTPAGKDWIGAYEEEGKNRAFQNTRNLLRSIYLGLVTGPEELANHERLKLTFLDALSDLKPY